jgi:hypothetical protein
VFQLRCQIHRKRSKSSSANFWSSTVQQVFGEVATCKVAHSQKLRQKVTEEQLDNDYRNEAALTIALMGLMAEESLIAQRLGKLGRKKISTVMASDAT